MAAVRLLTRRRETSWCSCIPSIRPKTGCLPPGRCIAARIAERRGMLKRPCSTKTPMAACLRCICMSTASRCDTDHEQAGSCALLVCTAGPKATILPSTAMTMAVAGTAGSRFRCAERGRGPWRSCPVGTSTTALASTFLSRMNLFAMRGCMPGAATEVNAGATLATARCCLTGRVTAAASGATPATTGTSGWRPG